jgi:hypothetical protein
MLLVPRVRRAVFGGPYDNATSREDCNGAFCFRWRFSVGAFVASFSTLLAGTSMSQSDASSIKIPWSALAMRVFFCFILAARRDASIEFRVLMRDLAPE